MLRCFLSAEIWFNLSVPSENTEQRKLAVIKFTDMVDCGVRSQRTEAHTLELPAENQRLLRTQFPLFHGREVKITISPSTLNLMVSDSGIGMTPEQLGKLFQEFERAENSTSKK